MSSDSGKDVVGQEGGHVLDPEAEAFVVSDLGWVHPDRAQVSYEEDVAQVQ